MKPGLITIVLLTSTAIGHADELDGPPASASPAVVDHGYASLGWEALLDSADSGAGAYVAEGGARLWDAPVLAHALVGRGGYATDEGSGPFTEIRLGLEAETCSEGRLLCGFIGLDAGHRWASWRSKADGMTTDLSGELFVGRAGFDAGNAWLRVRVDLEATGDAFGIQLAVMHRFYAR